MKKNPKHKSIYDPPPRIASEKPNGCTVVISVLMCGILLLKVYVVVLVIIAIYDPSAKHRAKRPVKHVNMWHNSS